MSHLNALQHNKIVTIPFNKTVVKTHLYYAGISDIFHASLYAGSSLPKTIIIVLCSNKRVDGDYTLNPYNFEHYGVKELYVKLNGVKQIPVDSYTPDFAAEKYPREYQMFQDNLGLKFNDVSNSIGYGYWGQGCTMFSLDLTSDNCGGWHKHEKRSGHLDLYIKLKSPLTSPMYVMSFASYDAVLGIDKNMNVNVDY
jgi:hypothetical protein